MAERLVEYNIIKREAEANKALYDGLMTKLKEVGISAALQSSNVRVVDPAMIPTSPSRPAKARNIALAFLVGLVGGIGLALMREYLDNTVKTPDDIETSGALAFPRRCAAVWRSQRQRHAQAAIAGHFLEWPSTSASNLSPSTCPNLKCPKLSVLCALLCCFHSPDVPRRSFS